MLILISCEGYRDVCVCTGMHADTCLKIKSNPIHNKKHTMSKIFPKPRPLCLEIPGMWKYDHHTESWLSQDPTRVSPRPSERSLMQPKVRYAQQRGFQCKTDSASPQVWPLQVSIFGTGCGRGEFEGALSREVAWWQASSGLKWCGP